MYLKIPKFFLRAKARFGLRMGRALKILAIIYVISLHVSLQGFSNFANFVF